MGICGKRDELVDCLKGYACLLVVFGHVILGVRNGGIQVPFFSKSLELYIWSFHMALFMFLSGYVYKITGEYTSKKSRLGFIRHKLLNLGIPYVVFSIIYILVNSVTPGVNNEKGISDILILWRTPIAQYWYLYALFTLFVIWTVLSRWLKNWQITLFMFIVGYFLQFANISSGILSYGFVYAVSFGLGTSIPYLYFDKCSKHLKMLIISAHILIETIIVSIGITGMAFVDDIEEILGIASSIAFVSLLSSNISFKKFLLYINRYSFPIYLLHTFFTAFIRIILLKCHISDYWVHIMIATVLGIVGPIIIGCITARVPVLDFFFYPSKSIKRLQRKK